MVKSLDKATGQATVEEIENERLIAFEGIQKGEERLDILFFDEEHPNLQFISGLLWRGSSLENGKEVILLT